MKSFFAALTLAAALCFAAGNTTFGQEAGGTKAVVTQASSVSTGVTISGNSGVITGFTSTQVGGAAAPVTFTVTNPAVIAANSVVIANVVGYSGTTGTPAVRVNNIVSGAFDVIVTNVHPSAALNGVYKIGFIVD